ncbi:UDP-glucose 4-epimerase GalE [Qingshengfaniella alkalisoli]|uniref:UDP-glucose 4-epimerase n=1 Tax=Qingshengfaniella alkalisoli TaxID=2599296 RepID=A0A5B8J7E4_9RHOB|nr:UDP-glucose 4-epimerase GalE [Qingshengfaniella alkalisoli]QDY70397.1 UDP-glucose 4-epimerase GalE [Qingshengfaniella alkalisoli]
MTSTVLVTGGAGYIGSHACKALAEAGYTPVTFDSFVTGWRDAVQFGPLEEGDLRDPARLDEVFAKHKPVAVMHFAALSDVGQSARDPGLYWDNNVIGSLRLIEAMQRASVEHIAFSSTCATYGEQDGVMLDETCPQQPINAYGASKRAVEDLIRNFAAAPGAVLNHVFFRYFNVAGADPDGQVGEFHRPETHLIPLALDAVRGRRDKLTIFGQDYPTPDGTCVRDYVHVTDLIAAHVLGLEYLLKGGASEVFNLGTGRGFSVREVVEAVARVTDEPVPAEDGPRRAGDCAALVSGSRKAADVLGWSPDHSTLEQMISTAWAWHQKPGYRN